MIIVDFRYVVSFFFAPVFMLVFALAFLVGSQAAQAGMQAGMQNGAQAGARGIMTALQLQQLCDSPYDVDAGMCAGYVMAVAERIQQDPNPASRVCLSPAIGPQILVQNVQRAWEQHPPAAYDLAVENVEALLRQRFKCI